MNNFVSYFLYVVINKCIIFNVLLGTYRQRLLSRLD
jgi:hypothetical protein